MRIYPALGVSCILNKVGVVCSFDERSVVWRFRVTESLLETSTSVMAAAAAAVSVRQLGVIGYHSCLTLQQQLARVYHNKHSGKVNACVCEHVDHWMSL